MLLCFASADLPGPLVRLVSTSKSAIDRITLMGRATGPEELTGAGFRDIGTVITQFGFMDTTAPAN